MVKNILLGALFLSLSLILFVGFLLGFLSAPFHQRPGTVEIKVEQGESFSSVVNRLKDRGVISNGKIFTLWARLRFLDKRIQWGRYRFDLPMAPRKVLNRMVLGKGLFQRVTVAEGLNLMDIASLMEREGLDNRERFLKEAGDPELLSLFGLQETGVEGYLFPDTYHFSPSTSGRDILVAMIKQFEERFTPVMEEQAKRIGLDRHQVVTLASLIEKETGVDAERPIVSAVFHNRLRDRIPLQSDPTVIYGLKDFTGNLTRRDLRTPSPYNTYLIRGLPPGPISNPGLASLWAALFPAEVSYLYFVSKNDGTHFFSETIGEHNQAVNQYQRRRSNGH